MDANRQNRRFCKLAAGPIVCLLCWALLLVLRSAIVHPLWLRALLWHLMAIVVAAGFLLGMLAAKRIMASSRRLKGSGLAVAGMIISALLLGVWLLGYIGPRCYAYRMVCGTNLSQLGKAMVLYAHEHGRYPDPNKWCDELLAAGQVEPKHFICITSRRGIVIRWPPRRNGREYLWSAAGRRRSDYAMNPHCDLNSPPDMVLLFEGKTGWNQFGGVELVDTGRHQGEGCNILFNDASVSFCKANFAEKLNWKGETRKQNKLP